MLKTIRDFLAKQSPGAILFGGLFLTAIVGCADFMKRYEVSVSILYLGPISLVAWYAGRVAGLLVALSSAVVWLLSDLRMGHASGHVLISYWNAAVILGEFLVVSGIVRRLQAAHEKQVGMIAELQEAATNIRILQGLIPICAWCKKIRTDEGYWQEVDTYITAHSEAAFTHCICPDCGKNVRKQFGSIHTNRPKEHVNRAGD